MRFGKEETDRLLVRVEQHLQAAPEFTPAETQMLHSMVEAWRLGLAIGRGIKWVIVALGMLAAAVASIKVLGGTLGQLFGRG